MEELKVLSSLIEGRIPQDWAGSPLEAVFTSRYASLERPEDEWGADHYQVIGMEVFPFASVFLTETAQMGGEPSEWAAEVYRRGGWYPKTQPEQACAMLRFLDHCLGHDPELAGEFLSRQMLTWFPIFTLALTNLQHPFFSPLGRRIDEVLQGLVDQLHPEPYQAVLAPLGTDFLENPEHGLKEIAKALLTPCQSGIYFSRVDQMQIAHALQLPASFATRSQVMPSLWYASVDFHKQVELTQALVEFATSWQSALQSSPFTPWVQPWVHATQGTLAMLPLIKPQEQEV